MSTQTSPGYTSTDVTQKHLKMTKDAKLEGSSQQANKDAINKRNGLRTKTFEVLPISVLKMEA